VNYKQMLLLEELVNHMGINGNFRLRFIIDNVMCTGDFRNGQDDKIDTEKLIDDFIQYMNANEEYFGDLRNRLEENIANKGEKFKTTVFNSMVVFLMESEKRVEGYLKAPKISEVIYNFHKGNEYHERYPAHGIMMDPFEMY